MSDITNESSELQLNERMREPELRERPSLDGASELTLPNVWRRRFSAIGTNEFVRTCLLSLIACGPIPPVQPRRHH